MAVSLKLKRVTLDCLNATNLSLSNPENIIKLDKSTGTVYFENGGVCYVSKLKLKKLLERISL